MKIGFVCGLADERRIIDERTGGAQGVVAVTGADPARALALTRKLIADGTTGLVSFGLGGGLDPALETGALVVDHRVATREGMVDGDGAWAAEIRTALSRHDIAVRAAPVFGADLPILSPAHKAELFAAYGAAVVDMESAAVAQGARDAGLPFVVVRAVADDAGSSVPAYATDAIGADGHADVWSVLGGLAGDPLSLPGLIGVALGAGKAYAALRRAAPFIHGPAFQQ
jgi:adenosylhomocysteine nucleosidase